MFEIASRFVLCLEKLNQEADRKARPHVQEVCNLLFSNPQQVVSRVHQWIVERPYALKVELEVARAILHTYSKDEGLLQKTIFNRYAEKLSGLGYTKEFEVPLVSEQEFQASL